MSLGEEEENNKEVIFEKNWKKLKYMFFFTFFVAIIKSIRTSNSFQ